MSMAFWIAPVSKRVGRKPEEIVKDLIGRRKLYAFRDAAKGLKIISRDDWVCFYTPGIGVVAHAQLATSPERGTSIEHLSMYPWIVRLKNVSVYIEDPVRIDKKIRGRLDAFKDKNLDTTWSWFVQSNQRLTQHDFETLVRNRIGKQFLDE